jgi:TonB-dependent SusC/RagA subfamily outer membrane receptor
MRKRILLICVCLLVGIGMATAQNLRKVNGVVTSSEDGLPVIGASVVVKGSTLGVTTDVNGAFALSVPASATTLQISYVGMTTQEVAIKAGKLKVILVPVQKQLDEVVVVAYGTAKKQSLTGSISVVDSKKIENRISSNVTAALEGSTPGVQVNNTYGEPGSAPSIRIRGFSSVNGSNSPLYVVDGVPFDGSINDINPNDVESISILKDAASSALYGNRAANGVILITTKKGKITGKINVTFSANQGMFTRGIPEYDRMHADQWMETAWIGMKNYALSLPIKGITTPEQAASYASAHLIDDMFSVISTMLRMVSYLMQMVS